MFPMRMLDFDHLNTNTNLREREANRFGHLNAPDPFAPANCLPSTIRTILVAWVTESLAYPRHLVNLPRSRKERSQIGRVLP